MDIADKADWLPEAERCEGVRRVQAALLADGCARCIGCGEAIDPARRAAMPSARRCNICQGWTEKRDSMRARPPIVGDGL